MTNASQHPNSFSNHVVTCLLKMAKQIHFPTIPIIVLLKIYSAISFLLSIFLLFHYSSCHLSVNSIYPTKQHFQTSNPQLFCFSLVCTFPDFSLLPLLLLSNTSSSHLSSPYYSPFWLNLPSK